MGKIIFFRLGERDRITVSQFVRSLKNILGVLEDLDASISNKKTGNMRWEVAVLSKQSPPLIGIKGSPISIKRPDTTLDIQQAVFGGIDMLAEKAERSSYYSDSVLEKIRKLAIQSKTLGPLKVYSESNGDGEKGQEAKITESTLINIEELIGVKYKWFGSISGNLDAVFVHKRYEFKIWDEKTGRPITCFFSPAKLDMVKDNLKQKVLVYGEINANQRGEPVSVMVEDIEPRKLLNSLPTIKEMSGLVKDMYEGKTLKEYLEEIDND